jgi:hypothetical protein
MALIRTQIVQTVRQADPARDACVNDVWHTVDNTIIWGGPDYQNHANEIRDLFSGQAAGHGATFRVYSGRGLLVKVYNFADPKPRPIRAQATYTPTTWEVAGLGPREIASCLSYYGTNKGIATQRGRIYIGPFAASAMAETVPQAYQDELIDLGHGLFDIGGENVAHVVHSHKLLTDTVVQNYWVNDLWDHMSSREEKELHRTTLAP